MLVLASRSPQRREILEQLGVEFRVEPADVEEVASGPPDWLVLENAGRKASAVSGGEREAVLGADTAVALGERVYGKPESAEEAGTFLRELSGREHEVHGGVVLRMADGAERTAHAVTKVCFRPLDDSTSTRTLRPASGASARAATRSRVVARASSTGSRATTSTSSACRYRPSWPSRRSCSAERCARNTRHD